MGILKAIEVALAKREKYKAGLGISKTSKKDKAIVMPS